MSDSDIRSSSLKLHLNAPSSEKISSETLENTNNPKLSKNSGKYKRFFNFLRFSNLITLFKQMISANF